MKILIVHDFNPFRIGGGVEINTRYLASEIGNMGHEVALGYHGQFGSGDLPGLKGVPINDIAGLEKAFNYFDNFIFLGSMSLRPLFLIGPQILIKQKRSFLLYFRSSSLHRPFSERLKSLMDIEVQGLDAEMHDVVADSCSIVVANSRAMRSDLLNMYPASQSKGVHIVYPGTAWPLQSPKERPIQNNFVFLSVGRLTIDKGILSLWEAFYHLNGELRKSSSNKRIELKVVGSGELDRTLRFLTTEFGLSQAISFYGKIEHGKVFEHMSTSHVLVHPALLEPFGNVIVEALGVALPVIASDFDGPREILDHGKYGALIPRANTCRLEETMKEAVLDSDFYNDLAERAKKSAVRERYSVANQASALLDIMKGEA